MTGRQAGEEQGRVEAMSRELHAIYMAEVRRQGDVVRHSDDYDALSESTKNYDRVLARWIIAREDVLKADLDVLARWIIAREDVLKADLDRLRDGAIKQAHETEQILGKALGYPWYKDDPKSFPDATEADGVCVGDHVPESLAAEAADRLDRLRGECDLLRGTFEDACFCGFDAVGLHQCERCGRTANESRFDRLRALVREAIVAREMPLYWRQQAKAALSSSSQETGGSDVVDAG